MIKTEHLLIRKFHTGDLPDVYYFLSAPAATAFSGLAPFTIEKTREWLLHHLDSYPEVEPLGVFALETRRTKRVIGFCGLEKLPPEIADEIEITVALVPEVWGNGYGMESISALLEYAYHSCRLKQVVAVVHVENQHAKNLFRTCGFRQRRKVIVEDVGPHLLFIKELSKQEIQKWER